MNESVKVSNSTVQLRNAKQRICLSRSNWLGVLLQERKIKLHTFLWDNRGPDGRKDLVKGLTKVIPNPFKVVQTLLNIAVIVSLRDYWHFLKELSRLFADMRLNHASPRALPLCFVYLFVFVLGQSYIVYASEFWMISWFSFSRTNSTNAISSPVLIMSWSVLIVNTFWCSVFIHTRQEELRHSSVHNLTWQAY